MDTKNQPILLEESTLELIPYFLERLILVNTQQESNSSQDLRLHILALLSLYVSMEVGFVPETFQMSSENLRSKSSQIHWGFDRVRLDQCVSQPLPDTFKTQSHFRLNIKLINDETKCVLLLMRSGDSLFTSITSKEFKGQSLYLSAERYVPYVNKQKLARSFRALSDFSLELKNHLCLPIRDAILADNGQVFPGLLGLPEGQLDFILQYLKGQDLKHLAWTCSYLCLEVKNFKKRNKRG